MPDFVDIGSISMLINNKQTIISGIYKSPNSDIKLLVILFIIILVIFQSKVIYFLLVILMLIF